MQSLRGAQNEGLEATEAELFGHLFFYKGLVNTHVFLEKKTSCLQVLFQGEKDKRRICRIVILFTI